MAQRLEANQILGALNGTPTFLGKIVATTTKNNHDTAVPFNDTAVTNDLSGKVLLIQPDANCYILPGIVNTATVTTANGVYLVANERVSIAMGSYYGWLACVSSSGTTNCRVWELV